MVKEEQRERGGVAPGEEVKRMTAEKKTFKDKNVRCGKVLEEEGKGPPGPHAEAPNVKEQEKGREEVKTHPRNGGPILTKNLGAYTLPDARNEKRGKTQDEGRKETASAGN